MLIDREQVLDCLNRNAEQIRETLDDYLLFTAEEEKFSWGLGLVESMIADVEELPSAEPNVLDDGTLTITVPHGMLSKVNRVIVDEVGTKFCKMMYQDALPSAERTGHWIQISPAKIYECSECGQNVMTDDIDCYRHCHGCGARMVSK